MENHQTAAIRRWHIYIHRDQAIVEVFKAPWQKSCQYAVEMRFPEGQWSPVWVKRLPDCVATLNNEGTRKWKKAPLPCKCPVFVSTG